MSAEPTKARMAHSMKGRSKKPQAVKNAVLSRYVAGSSKAPSTREKYSVFRNREAAGGSCNLRICLRPLVLIEYGLLSVLFVALPGICQTTLTKSDVAHTVERLDEGFYSGAHLYPEAPLEVLLEHIPELGTLQPASDQRELAFILKNTGLRVDDYFRDVMNLIADEEVTQQKLNDSGAILEQQRLHYSYMILLHREEKPARFEEYRQDSFGKSAAPRENGKGFSVTTGFTTKCLYFSTAHQRDSTFRYLGEQMLGKRNTYVVAFAQLLGSTRISNTVNVGWAEVAVHDQGIVWIEKNTFRVIQLRTDLLAPPTELGLDRQTTGMTFEEIQLPDTVTPSWVPSEVNVDAVFDGMRFRNEHRYTNYRRFRVSIKMN